MYYTQRFTVKQYRQNCPPPSTITNPPTHTHTLPTKCIHMQYIYTAMAVLTMRINNPIKQQQTKLQYN